MGRRSNIERLPELVRDALDRELDRNAYSSLGQIAADFRRSKWKVSKSGLWRYALKRQSFKAAARFEAEVLKSFDDVTAYLIRWVRAHPKDAERLVKRLRAEEQQ